MHARRAATSVIVALALASLAACGSPAGVHTFDDEPDLASIDNTIPKGFLEPVHNELRRLNAACSAIDREVRSSLANPTASSFLTLELNDAQCQWIDEGEPRLIVGTLESAHGGTALDETASVLTNEQSIDDVGARAVFDLQTRTLYVQQNGRLWYLQLVNSAPGVAARSILTTLARVLVQTASAR